jgi:hypothetical protein
MSRSLGHRLPDRLAARLDGAAADAGFAIVLATVDEAGHPHFALLSTAEVLATGPRTVRLGTYSTSGTSTNLRERGTLGLCIVDDGSVFYVKGRVQELPAVAGHPGIARFEAQVEDVREDAPRAEEGEASVLSGITFRRHRPVAPLGDMLRA